MYPLVKIVDLYKSFGSLEVLKGISTTVEKGEKLKILLSDGILSSKIENKIKE